MTRSEAQALREILLLCHSQSPGSFESRIDQIRGIVYSMQTRTGEFETSTEVARAALAFQTVATQLTEAELPDPTGQWASGFNVGLTQARVLVECQKAAFEVGTRGAANNAWSIPFDGVEPTPAVCLCGKRSESTCAGCYANGCGSEECLAKHDNCKERPRRERSFATSQPDVVIDSGERFSATFDIDDDAPMFIKRLITCETAHQFEISGARFNHPDGHALQEVRWEHPIPAEVFGPDCFGVAPTFDWKGALFPGMELVLHMRNRSELDQVPFSAALECANRPPPIMDPQEFLLPLGFEPVEIEPGQTHGLEVTPSDPVGPFNRLVVPSGDGFLLTAIEVLHKGDRIYFQEFELPCGMFSPTRPPPDPSDFELPAIKPGMTIRLWARNADDHPRKFAAVMLFQRPPLEE